MQVVGSRKLGGHILPFLYSSLGSFAFLMLFAWFFCFPIPFCSFFCQFLCCSLSSPTGRIVQGCHLILIFRQTKPFLLLVCLFGTWRHRHWHLACQTCLNIGRIRTLELRAVEKTASCISFQLLASFRDVLLFPYLRRTSEAVSV